MKNFFRQNLYYFIAVLILLVFGGVILLLFHKETVTLWVNQHYSRFVDILILCVDKVGTIWFNLLVVAGLWLWKGWKTAIQGATCFLITTAVVQFFKHIIFPGELRPTLHFEGKAVLRLVEGVTQLSTESFPSGHTAAAFAVAGVLAFNIKCKPLQWLFVLLAAIVGYGRIYLSQHFINDVYAGMIIGVVVTTVVYLLMDKILKINKYLV